MDLIASLRLPTLGVGYDRYRLTLSPRGLSAQPDFVGTPHG